MAVATYNFTWEQGSDLVIPLLLKTTNNGSEVPLVLTGYSLRMDIATNNTNTGVRLYTFNSGDISEISDTNKEIRIVPAEGRVEITVDRGLTLPGGDIYTRMISGTPPQNTFVYDIFIRDPQNKQKKILSGGITVNRSITLWT